MSRLEGTQRLSDDRSEGLERFARLHRVTQCRRGRQQIANLDRAILGVDFAKDLAHQRQRLTDLFGRAFVEDDAGLVVTRAGDHSRHALVIGVAAFEERALFTQHHHGSRLHATSFGQRELFGAIGIRQPDVAGHFDVAFETAGEQTALPHHTDSVRAVAENARSAAVVRPKDARAVGIAIYGRSD